ncbi:putative phosphatidylglycerol/phosphatidylinositol transfer protein DDB_G0278295, partial [Hibiscus syriacus]|uniref:putative phosphatidylglycerol/phosphatidylinositol transfer protein DDB_G0278295 n=1 Tax=Hibiscus syriacus TaxID=106335 RepID=UPI0019206A72
KYFIWRVQFSCDFIKAIWRFQLLIIQFSLPNPVAWGKPATFTISASTGQAISGGKAGIDVSYFGVHVHQETHPLCEETTCPISVGNFVLSHNQVLPGFTPPGSYTLKMTISGDGIPQLTCISFDFKIGFGTSGSSVSDI